MLTDIGEYVGQYQKDVSINGNILREMDIEPVNCKRVVCHFGPLVMLWSLVRITDSTVHDTTNRIILNRQMFANNPPKSIFFCC